MNPTPKTWIFRVHSTIYPPFQWNILSFEDCCQKSHAEMTAWLGLFPSFCFLFFFPLLSFLLSAFFHSPIPLSLLSITQPRPLHILLRFSPPLRWPSKTECPVLSVCHCLPAQEYQWPAAQSNQFLRGGSTVYLTSASLIIVSKHKPINSSQHLRLPTTKPQHHT